MADRTCSMPDCDKAYRAKGLCATHYNQQCQSNRHAKIEVACTQCGVAVMKFPNGGKRKPFCSWACQLTYQRADPGHAWNAGPRARSTELELHPNPTRRASKSASRASPKMQRPRWFVAGNCEVCRQPFVSQTTSLTCSAECASEKFQSDRREGKHRRRARERAAYVAPVYRRRIYERDRWRCQVCKRKVKRDAVAPQPLAPTIDHVIPLSLGGTHEPANVRLACFRCNSARGNRGGGEQLALIG